MEGTDFSRNRELGERIYVPNFVCSSSSSNYPVKLHQTSYSDIENMNIMIMTEEKKIVLVRGYKLEEQMRTREHCEENVDGTLNVCMSQETEVMFKNDLTFIQKLQQEQRDKCRDIMDSTEAINDEQVVIIREAINAIDNDKVLLNELTTELRTLVEIYKLMATTKKRKGTQNEIVFPITGKCTKEYDIRKGYY